MCELCGKDAVEVHSVEDLQDDLDEESRCEWMDEQADVEEGSFDALSCPEDAEFLVIEEYVEEHLCEMHAARDKGEMENGMGDFLDSLGFDPGTQIPIRGVASCEYFNPLSPGENCTRRAHYAKFVRVETLLCGKHARAGGYLSRVKK